MSTYNIVTIGAPGSGKTVYLAVLYNLITSGQLATGVRVKSDLQSTSWLDNLYKQVADPEAEFPMGTHPGEHLREVELVLSIERSQRVWFSRTPKLLSFEILRASYIDYAGEWVTESYRQDRDLVSEFQARVDDADIVLCFLDGQRMLSTIRQPTADPEFLNGQLRPTIRMAANLGKPVAIVITKWDTVMNEYSLEEVLTTLATDGLTDILDLAQTRSAKRLLTRRPIGGVSIIPVSSTGQAFVRTSTDGTSSKSGAQLLDPINVTVPFAVGLVEVARMGLAEMRANDPRKRASSGSLSRTVKATTDSVNEAPLPIGLAGISIDVKKTLAFAGELGVGTLRMMSGPARATGRRMRREYRRVRSLGIDGVRSEEGALLYFSRTVRRQLRDFSEDPSYGGSRIWSDGDEWDLIDD